MGMYVRSTYHFAGQDEERLTGACNLHPAATSATREEPPDGCPGATDPFGRAPPALNPRHLCCPPSRLAHRILWEGSAAKDVTTMFVSVYWRRTLIKSRNGSPHSRHRPRHVAISVCRSRWDKYVRSDGPRKLLIYWALGDHWSILTAFALSSAEGLRLKIRPVDFRGCHLSWDLSSLSGQHPGETSCVCSAREMHMSTSEVPLRADKGVLFTGWDSS